MITTYKQLDHMVTLNTPPPILLLRQFLQLRAQERILLLLLRARMPTTPTTTTPPAIKTKVFPALDTPHPRFRVLAIRLPLANERRPGHECRAGREGAVDPVALNNGF